jgi:O-antigen/teichoic acid export membrane protein
MNARPERTSRHLLDGTVWVLLAEALLFPTGLLTVACLSRRLGVADYGLYTLAAVLIAWIEWTIRAVFTAAAIRCVGETDDWRPVGARILGLYLAAGTGAAVLVVLLAGPIAELLGEPGLVPYLRLFALEIPIFCLAQAHRNILVGIGSFRQQALASATRWTAKMLLIVILVELGLSIWGAILGSMGATLAEFAVCRYAVRPPLFSRTPFPLGRLWGIAGPLFLFTLSIRLYDKMDLFFLKSLGYTAADAGIYGAAQNLAVVPAVLVFPFASLLLSTLSRQLRAGEDRQAHALARNALRGVIVLVPFACLVAGSADETVGLVYGEAFLPAAPLLAVLLFAALALVMLSLAAAILTAAGKPLWTFGMVGPLLPLAVGGHLVLIPRLGPLGAALVTTVVAGLGALGMLLAIRRTWGVFPPLPTLLRSMFLSVLAYTLTMLWPAPGFLLPLKLTLLGLVVVLGFYLLREWSADEIGLVRSWLSRRAASESPVPPSQDTSHLPEVVCSLTPPSSP